LDASSSAIGGDSPSIAVRLCNVAEALRYSPAITSSPQSGGRLGTPARERHCAVAWQYFPSAQDAPHLCVAAMRLPNSSTALPWCFEKYNHVYTSHPKMRRSIPGYSHLSFAIYLFALFSPLPLITLSLLIKHHYYIGFNSKSLHFFVAYLPKVHTP
jgi:hypothetical protein